MKKSILFAGLLMVSAMFIGCTNDGTPFTSSTKLWPAATVSKDAQTGEQKVKWGFIDEKGTMIIPASYDKVYDFSCGFAHLVQNSTQAGGTDSHFFMNEKQEMQSVPSNDEMDSYFYYDYVVYTLSGLKGMFNKKFENEVPVAYKYLNTMSEDGLAAFKKADDAKWGYLNNKEEVISAQYDEAGQFIGGIAVVKMGDLWGTIDKKNNTGIKYQQNELYNVGNDRVAYKDKDTKKYGLWDLDGTSKAAAVYDADYRSLYGFTDEGLMVVKQSDKYGYIDKNGKPIINIQYVDASPFYGGMAWVKRSNEANYEAINAKDKSIITLDKNTTPLGFFRQGLCLVRRQVEATATAQGGYEYSYIDEKGKPVFSWKYEGYYQGADPTIPTPEGSISGGNEDWGEDWGEDWDEDWGDYDYTPSNKMNIRRLMAPTRYGNRVRK